MSSDTGKWIIVIGIFVVLAGVIIYFFHDKLGWIGRLPGDIRVEKDNFRFYFPITTMIIFSLLLTLIIQLIKKFLN
jgi:O-antigen/teichoic acid export membrane protein